MGEKGVFLLMKRTLNNRMLQVGIATLLVFFLLPVKPIYARPWQSADSIRGKVEDETGLPLQGATVRLIESGTETLTDADGSFAFTVNSTEKTFSVEVSYKGYKTHQAKTKAGQMLQIQLMKDQLMLDDVVVIGYGTQKKKYLLGAAATVGSKDFVKGAITTPEQLIVGKVAGVSITSNSGQPGVGSTIRIRGGASLNASNDPLIVIDGVPLSGNTINGAPSPLSLLNPADIESFTVLKDAAATAIYGSRASNGVILVTTKKGKSGKPTITVGTQLIHSTINKKVDVLSAAEFRQYVDSLGTPAQRAMMGTATTDWQDEIYRNPTSSDNNVSISGSVKNIPYRIAAGFLSQNGLLLTDQMKRTSMAINLNPNFLKGDLKLNLSLRGSMMKAHYANQGAIANAIQFDPTQSVYDENSPFGGYFEWWARDPDTNEPTPNSNAPRNPVALIKQQDNNTQVNRSVGNLQVDYAFPFLRALHANLNLGYDVSKGWGSIFVPPHAAQNYPTKGTQTRFDQRTENVVGEFYLNYTSDIDALRSNVNLTAGYGYYDNKTTNYNFPTLNGHGDTLVATKPIFLYDIPRNVLVSYYGRLIYTFQDRYIVAASLRSDGSSRFAPENRWGMFPSVAFTWRVSQEKMLADSKALSDLKLRLSYGVTGNQDGIANYPYLASYSTSTNASRYRFGNNWLNMVFPSAYDANIKWEETTTYNAGLDYGWWDNRLTGTLDLYYKKTKNLLNTIPVPVGSNFSNQILTNVGNIENKGVEFGLNGVIVRNKSVNWEAGFNLTYNINNITNLTAVQDPSFAGNLTGGITGATGQSIQIHSVGYNTFAYYVFKQVYDKAGNPLEGVFEDLNKDGIINQNDQYRYKSPFPRYIAAFNTSLAYKNWNLSMVVRANFGNYIYDNISSNFGVGRSILSPSGILLNSTRDIQSSRFYNNYYQSDYYVKNASFLKLDNISLGYNAGRLMKDKVGMRLSAACQNPLVITRYKGIDPESTNGIDYNLYPRPVSFVLGVNFDF